MRILLPLVPIMSVLYACSSDTQAPSPDASSPDTDASVEDVSPSDTADGGPEDSQVPSDSAVDTTEDAADSASDLSDGHDDSVTPDTDAPPLELELTPLPPPDAIGGPLTRSDYGPQIFLSPSHLSEVITGDYSAGRELFVATWTEAPDTTRPLIDGLGPLFHAQSCVACHPTTGRAASLFEDGSTAEGVLIRLNRYDSDLGLWHGQDPYLGAQLQTQALNHLEPEAIVRWQPEPERTPSYISAKSPAYRLDVSYAASHPQPHPDTRLGARLSPHLMGMGLLDLVPEAAIIALEDPEDRDGDGISGRAARLHDGRIGRFGWKAIHATLETQGAAAFTNDIGITNPFHPSDDCTESQASCRSTLSGGQPELTGQHLRHVVEFMTYLAVPAGRYRADDVERQKGQAIFQQIGCASCHQPSLKTGPSSEFPVLANLTFYPYTDLLLHDMGEGLADPIAEGDASASEWRTPPLWGLGLVARDANARFLHDGRAKTIEDAILWHGGEAEATRQRYQGLHPVDKELLLQFLSVL